MSEDWREQGQESYLSGLEFRKKQYKRFSETWEHDHCEFCNSKFCEPQDGLDCLHEGYATEDNYRWICEDCFIEFKEKYNLMEKGVSTHK